MKHNYKLTPDIVRAIRAEYFPYVRGCKKLAKKYGLAATTILQIVNFDTHKRIK